jgi:hypothetical protein
MRSFKGDPSLSGETGLAADTRDEELDCRKEQDLMFERGITGRASFTVADEPFLPGTASSSSGTLGSSVLIVPNATGFRARASSSGVVTAWGMVV